MFGMDLYELGPDRGELHSWNQIEVAVDCWFTSAGRMMPLRMKCREGDKILTIEPIAVLKEEENRYAGVLVHIFYCKARLESGVLQEFSLLFYVEQCLWKAYIAG